jgi:MoaA/NifB/PqqE/SkfB family radical SAM enzyme
MSLISNFLKTDLRCKSKFIINMGLKGALGFRKFKKRREKGELFPAFQFISVTNDCNLSCQGCWVTTDRDHKAHLNIDTIHAIIDGSKKQGSHFFGILGGEPLMYKQVTGIFEKHPDCYFQLFTNGTLFTTAIAEKLRQTANVTPLFSFEGDEQVADIRRGGNNIYNRTLEAIKTSVQHGLITGVAISVCKTNIDMALSREFVQMLHDMGVLYVWYYIYRPAGENPNYELALDREDIIRLRQFLVDGRVKYPIVMIDSYWRANGEPFCPAAEGLSHHINASGYIEPCPVIQLAREKIDSDNIINVYEKSEFLKDFRNSILHKTKGCVLMEDPVWISQFAQKHQAVNTSNRPGMMAQFESAPVVVSHGSIPLIPEKSWIYRFAKNTAFFGMGAYG